MFITSLYYIVGIYGTIFLMYSHEPMNYIYLTVWANSFFLTAKFRNTNLVFAHIKSLKLTFDVYFCTYQ